MHAVRKTTVKTKAGLNERFMLAVWSKIRRPRSVQQPLEQLRIDGVPSLERMGREWHGIRIQHRGRCFQQRIVEEGVFRPQGDINALEGGGVSLLGSLGSLLGLPFFALGKNRVTSTSEKFFKYIQKVF